MKKLARAFVKGTVSVLGILSIIYALGALWFFCMSLAITEPCWWAGFSAVIIFIGWATYIIYESERIEEKTRLEKADALTHANDSNLPGMTATAAITSE